MKAIIGGTGLYDLGGEEKRAKTKYGEAVYYLLGNAVFITRHGKDHKLSPAKINYKANISLLKELAVKEVLTINAVGSLEKSFKPGDFVLCEDFIGLFTPITFYETFENGMKHADVSEPFNKELNRKIKEIGESIGIEVKEGGIVATTYGNRFETKAENLALKSMGANLLSMTNAYETTLINELKLDYEIKNSCLAVVTNYGTGISEEKLSHSHVKEVFDSSIEKLKRIVEIFIRG